MINPQLKLNTKIFDQDAERVSMRDSFGLGLLEAGEKDEKIVALSADLSESTRFDIFKKKFPERYVEMGVAEQNMATVASGLANYGKIPFIGSFAVFSPGRNWEQIRTTIVLNNLKVVIVGCHSGVNVGADGATHQALEDIALTRVLPNMQVIVLCDAEEARKAVLAVAKTAGPSYIRLEREKSPAITTAETPFEIGKANLVWQSEKPSVAIIACGSSVATALFSAKKLEEENISVLVLNLHTIKPIDQEAVINVAKKTGRVVTVEDHQVAGGMGSAVAEVLAENYPVPMRFVGIRDQFGQSGKSEELKKHYEIGVSDVVDAVKKSLKNL
jgi:transketolase